MIFCYPLPRAVNNINVARNVDTFTTSSVISLLPVAGVHCFRRAYINVCVFDTRGVDSVPLCVDDVVMVGRFILAFLSVRWLRSRLLFASVDRF